MLVGPLQASTGSFSLFWELLGPRLCSACSPWDGDKCLGDRDTKRKVPLAKQFCSGTLVWILHLLLWVKELLWGSLALLQVPRSALDRSLQQLGRLPLGCSSSGASGCCREGLGRAFAGTSASLVTASTDHCYSGVCAVCASGCFI